MASEPVKYLFHVLDKLQSGPQTNEGFLPVETSYPTEFDPKGISIALSENGAGDIDLLTSVRKEFYPMAEELKKIVLDVADYIDNADHGILAQVDKLAELNDTAFQSRLGKSLDSLISQNCSKLSSEHISSTLGCIRLLATQVTALKLARAELLGCVEGKKYDKTLDGLKSLLSPPYGTWGQILTSYLNKVTHYYEDHKYQLDILKEAYQTELDANKGLIKWHGLIDWLDWSYDYLRQNRDKYYSATDTKYARRDVGGPSIVTWRLHDDGLESYVKDVQRAQVVDGHVQYPDGILSDDKYREFIVKAFKWTANDPNQLDCGVNIMRYATKQESVRKAMQEEADHEYWRGPWCASFKRLCSCQQHSYAAADELSKAISRLINLVFHDLEHIICNMTGYLEDTYCNVVAGDFHSAREDYNNFLIYHNKLQNWRSIYNSMFS